MEVEQGERRKGLGESREGLGESREGQGETKGGQGREKIHFTPMKTKIEVASVEFK